MAILAGSALSKTFPPLANEFALKGIIDLVRQYKSGIAVCQTWRQDNQVKAHSYVDIFMRARLAVKYSLILTTEGACVPLPLEIAPTPPVTPADVPADFDEIFSLRLPDEMYFHICKGLISPQVVGWLTSGMIVELQPLADSPDYRRFIKDVVTEGHTAPRCTTLALLTDALHPQWKQRRVVGRCKIVLTVGSALLLRTTLWPAPRHHCTLCRSDDSFVGGQVLHLACPVFIARDGAEASKCRSPLDRAYLVIHHRH